MNALTHSNAISIPTKLLSSWSHDTCTVPTKQRTSLVPSKIISSLGFQVLTLRFRCTCGANSFPLPLPHSIYYTHPPPTPASLLKLSLTVSSTKILLPSPLPVPRLFPMKRPTFGAHDLHMALTAGTLDIPQSITDATECMFPRHVLSAFPAPLSSSHISTPCL